MELRKFARLPGPPVLVREIFVAVEAWPRWMPGVNGVEVLERTPERVRATVDQTLRGRSVRQLMEFQLHRDGMRQLQIEGWFKKWDARWRFLDPPDREGTTVALTVELDLGLAGLFSPRSLVDATIDEIFRQVVEGATSRVEEVLRGRTAALEKGELVIEILEVPGGLELIWSGRRFTLREE